MCTCISLVVYGNNGNSATETRITAVFFSELHTPLDMYYFMCAFYVHVHKLKDRGYPHDTAT